MKTFVYRNNTDILFPNNNYIKVELVGNKGNVNGIGSKVYIYSMENTYMLEQMPIRGFQSTVDNNLIVGIGESNNIDSLIVIWDDGSYSKKYDITPNQKVVIHKSDGIILDSYNKNYVTN